MPIVGLRLRSFLSTGNRCALFLLVVTVSRPTCAAESHGRVGPRSPRRHVEMPVGTQPSGYQGQGGARIPPNDYPTAPVAQACPDCGSEYCGGELCCLWRPGDLLRCVAHTVWPPSFLRHSSTDGRSTGHGQPLGGTSWLNRPFHVGWFAGSMWGDRMIQGEVDQRDAFFGGYQIGRDFDHFWGSQLRFAWASPDLTPGYARNGRTFLLDADLVYYPWGDSRVRPYFLAGLGLGRFDVRDTSHNRHIETLIGLPFGIGIKHHFRRWLSFRMELLDNLAFANGSFQTMHNVSLAAGIEVHFGVRPKSYWPWNPSRHRW